MLSAACTAGYAAPDSQNPRKGKVMGRTIAWGIISTGIIAKRFAAALRVSRNGRAAAVASRSIEQANRFGDELGIDKRYGSYEALLGDPGVDAVYIATPHPHHALWAIRAAEAKKHLLVEKPIGINFAEAAAIVEAARDNDVFLMEAFMYRCHPQIARLVELLEAGAIGKVRLIQASFGFHTDAGPEHRLLSPALGGGGILDVGCYPVSIARLIAGASLGTRLAEPLDVQGSAGFSASGVDGWAIGNLKFPGDILAQLATGVLVQLDRVVRIFGSDGYIELPQPWGSGDEDSRIILHPRGAEREEIVVFNDKTGYTLEADLVAEHLEARQAPYPAMSLADTLGNVQVLDRWRRAIGLRYPGETLESFPAPVSGRPVRRQEPVPITTRAIDGLDKRVSRLVMGAGSDPARTAVLWDAFFERGGNAFDTSFWYGRGATDKLLGTWIDSRGVRKQTVIIAKGAHTPGCYPEELTRQLFASLESLKTDFAEIYFMHRDNEDIPVGEFVDVLNEHYDKGRIRVFGGSNWTIARLEAAREYAKKNGKVPMSALSNNFSLARMVNPVWAGCIAASDPESRAWLEKNQVPQFSWSSQARGFFVRGNPNQRTDAELVHSWYSDDNFERLRRACELGTRFGVSANNVALAYVLCQPFPSFCLIGPQSLEELRTTLPALQLSLSESERRWLNLEQDSL
jgi:predicted dehydrogenase/aryl-alcohol dehydrogenase-like predicted oxidoreductase